MPSNFSVWDVKVPSFCPASRRFPSNFSVSSVNSLSFTSACFRMPSNFSVWDVKAPSSCPTSCRVSFNSSVSSVKAPSPSVNLFRFSFDWSIWRLINIKLSLISSICSSGIRTVDVITNAVTVAGKSNSRRLLSINFPTVPLHQPHTWDRIPDFDLDATIRSPFYGFRR